MQQERFIQKVITFFPHSQHLTGSFYKLSEKKRTSILRQGWQTNHFRFLKNFISHTQIAHGKGT